MFCHTDHSQKVTRNCVDTDKRVKFVPFYRWAPFDMKLRQYLIEAGLSQSEFARRAGIRQGQVWSVLQGRGLSVKNALKVERASLGSVRVEDLVGNPSG